ncbi:MAG: hypothetical protein J6W60_01140 [Treponema sp.]|nr:hypothetical protein [Treponema sp.]
MTFEEWKEKHSDLIENVAITFFNYERGVDTKTCFDELEYLLKRTFNAGRPKWHKVADGDLPKNEGWVCNQDGLPCWYDWNTEQWFACGGVPIRTIAWCETPHIPTEEVEV